MGLAPTGVWRAPPPPLQLEDPSLKPKVQSGVGGGVLGGVEGEGPPAVLGARPTSGGTRMK